MPCQPWSNRIPPPACAALTRQFPAAPATAGGLGAPGRDGPPTAACPGAPACTSWRARARIGAWGPVVHAGHDDPVLLGQLRQGVSIVGGEHQGFFAQHVNAPPALPPVRPRSAGAAGCRCRRNRGSRAAACCRRRRTGAPAATAAPPRAAAAAPSPRPRRISSSAACRACTCVDWAILPKPTRAPRRLTGGLWGCGRMDAGETWAWEGEPSGVRQRGRAEGAVLLAPAVVLQDGVKDFFQQTDGLRGLCRRDDQRRIDPHPWAVGHGDNTTPQGCLKNAAAGGGPQGLQGLGVAHQLRGRA